MKRFLVNQVIAALYMIAVFVLILDIFYWRT